MSGEGGSLAPVVRVVQWLTAAAVVVTVALLFVNPPSGSVVPAGDGDAAVAVDGAAVYSGRCASCHGATGGGGSGPALAGGRLLEVYPDPADQVAVVTNGRNGMPAFSSRLSPEEIDAVVEYTRTL